MTRKTIIQNLKKYFDLRELVCPHTYQRMGDGAWSILRTEQLHTILVLREDILKCGMVCNDYIFTGGNKTQRGNRCNICQLVKDKSAKNIAYLSAHCNCAANDFVFGSKSGMTAAKARELIKANAHLLPYNVRIEKDVTWLHIDTYDTGQKVYEFGV